MTETITVLQKYQAEIAACRKNGNPDFYVRENVMALLLSAREAQELQLLISQLSDEDLALAKVLTLVFEKTVNNGSFISK